MLNDLPKQSISSIDLSELEIRLLFALRVALENDLISNSDLFEINGQRYKILVTRNETINIRVQEK